MSWRGGREREREGEKEEKEKEKEREGRQEREEREREVTSLFRPSNFYLSASIVKSGVHRRLQRKEREKTEEKLQESKEMMRASVAGEQVEKRAQKRSTRKKKHFLFFFLLVPLAFFYSSTSKKTLRPAQLPSATFSRFPTMAAAFVTSGESSPFSVESRSRGRRRERTGGACPDALSPSCRFNHSSSSPLLCSKPMTLQPEPLRRCARTSTRRDPLGLRRRAARRARPQLRARFLC